MPTATLKRKRGAPLDVEGFPEGAARSRKGALRLAPGVPAHVTDDEAAHLEAIGAPVTVTSDPPPKPAPQPQAKAKKATALKTKKGKKSGKPATPKG